MDKQNFTNRMLAIYDSLHEEEQDRFIAMIEKEVETLNAPASETPVPA